MLPSVYVRQHGNPEHAHHLTINGRQLIRLQCNLEVIKHNVHHASELTFITLCIIDAVS